MKALMLGILLLASPAYACFDPDVSDDIQIAVRCRPFTVQPGSARCNLTVMNENQCHGVTFSGPIGVTTTYIPSDPGGIVSGDDLGRSSIRIQSLGTRRFHFMVPLDDLSDSVEILVHLTGVQEDTGLPFEIFRSETVFAPDMLRFLGTDMGF